MARVRAGDAGAFEELYDAHNRLVYRISLQILADVGDAEDVTQAVFLSIWSAPDTFQQGDFPPWIARLTRTHALDLLRSRSTRPEGEFPEAPLKAAAGAVPGSRLKQSIMGRVRADAFRSRAAKRPAAAPLRSARPIVWPAYLVAAACLAIALVTSITNISMSGQLRREQMRLAQASGRSRELARGVAKQQQMLADLVSVRSQRYAVPHGEVIRRGAHVYLAMSGMPMPPKGRVYQAWTLHAGAERMSPSLTFVPNRNGTAVVALPVDGKAIVAVAVSAEPNGGSKQPTSVPAFVVKLS